MAKIEIIPAIDIIGGECVRLTKGEYSQKTTYFKDPAEAAARYRDAGLRRLHLVDLDGARASSPANLPTLERIAALTGMDIQYGGGIKDRQALQAVFRAGANRAICGSVAVTQPDLLRTWLDDFGAGHIILGADVREGFVATHGWLETSTLTAEELIARFEPNGLSQVICTDISKDGMLSGPAFALYEKLQKRFPTIDVTVSGGISSMDDIRRLNDMGMRSVVVGKAIYEGRVKLTEIEKFITE